jgi:hypothetical protein
LVLRRRWWRLAVALALVSCGNSAPPPGPAPPPGATPPLDGAVPITTPAGPAPAADAAQPVSYDGSVTMYDGGGSAPSAPLGGDGLAQLLVSSGVGMGYYHACHLLASMDIKCFGSPLTHPRLRPPAGVKSTQVSCAHDGCCVLLPAEAGARLRCWSDKAPFFPPADILKAIDPVQVGVGYNHDCVLNTDHSVRCWGQAATKFTPPEGLKAKSLAVAAFFTCAVTMDDGVVCWGLNPPPPPAGLKAKLVAATFHGTSTLAALGPAETRHACAIKLDDTVACWGDDVGGNLAVPPDLGPVKDLAVATFNSCAVKPDGTPVCWGTRQYSDDPARVHPMPAGLHLKAIKAKMGSYCGIQLDDTLVCWGDSKTGHVTIPPGTKIYVPPAGPR